MCGRFSLTTYIEEIKKILDVDLNDVIDEMNRYLPPRQEIFPTEPVLAARIGRDGGRATMGMFRWGLVPFWSKEIGKSRPLINARAETVREKNSFKDAFQKRRCLIPATSFFEWKDMGAKKKEKFAIRMRNRELFVFAGLWERWDKDETPIESVTIITSAANEQMAELHERMPVILQPEQYAGWLDPGANPSDLCDWLKPGEEEFIIESTEGDRLF